MDRTKHGFDAGDWLEGLFGEPRDDPGDVAVEPPRPAGTPGRCPGCGGPQWLDGVGRLRCEGCDLERLRCEGCDLERLRAALVEAGFGGWLAAVEPDAAPAEADLPGWADASGWAELGGGVLARRNHPEAATLDWDTLDEAAEPCRACGSLAFWEDHDGRRHCGRCEPGPLDAARRLAERAAELRRRNPPSPKAKIPREGAWQPGGNPV